MPASLMCCRRPWPELSRNELSTGGPAPTHSDIMKKSSEKLKTRLFNWE